MDTNPGGVHTHFWRQFAGFDQKTEKSGHVDTLLPINNTEGNCPHFLGALWGDPFRGEEARAHPAECLKANLGGPFRCPRLCLLYVIYVDPVFVLTWHT